MSKTTAIASLDTVCRVIGSDPMQIKIAQALPPGINLDRFTRTTLTAIQTKPEIVEAEHNSLYNAILRAAQDGLLPDGRQGAITVYRTKVRLTNGQEGWIPKAQWMPMVEGCIHKLTKAGVMAYAVSVYSNDDFEVWNDEVGQHVRHRPPPRFGKRGDRVGAFALGRVLSTGAVYVEPMDMDELRRVMKSSKSAELDKNGSATKGPWKEWPERMEQKSCLHRLDKRIGTSALTDDDHESEENQAKMENSEAMGLPERAAVETPKRPRALQKVIDQATDAESSAGGDAQAGATSDTTGKPAPDEKAGSTPASPPDSEGIEIDGDPF